MLDHRAIALQGVGYPSASFALQGFLSVGEAVQIALETIQLITASINPSLLTSSILPVNVLLLHSSMLDPFFVGMLQIIRRGLKIHVSMTDDLIIPVRLVDSDE